MNRTLGMLLTLAGVIILILSLFSYTKKKNIVDVGPIKVSVDQKQSTDWMRYTGGILFIGGIVLLATSRRAR